MTYTYMYDMLALVLPCIYLAYLWQRLFTSLFDVLAICRVLTCLFRFAWSQLV